MASAKRRWLEKLIAFVAVSYLLALIGVWFGLRYFGESFWAATMALFLPRLGFGLPLPLVLLLVAWKLPRRWLALPLAALLVWLFPLMGFELGRERKPEVEAARIRVLTFNVGLGGQGVEAIASVLTETSADIVCLQEANQDAVPTLVAHLPPGYSFRFDGQFFLATRFPIEETRAPDDFADGTESRYVRYRLRTPRGALHVFSVHTTSPQAAFFEFRGDGLRRELLTGRLWRNADAKADLRRQTDARVKQLARVGEDAHGSELPLVIVGDTNSPGLSGGLARALGDFQDAFAEVGSGFGYSFPWQRVGGIPWMRIDRVLGNGQVRFLKVGMPSGRASDHLPVFAEFELTR